MQPLFRISFFLFLFIPISYGKGMSLKQTKEACKIVHQEWLKEALELTKNCVGFSAPVSSRAFAYLTIAMYESDVEIMEGNRTLSGQLQGFERKVWIGDSKKVCWPLVANYVDYLMIKNLYANAPPANKKKVEAMYLNLKELFNHKISKEIQLFSEAQALLIANEIIEWSKTDGGHEGYNRNFPGTYTPTSCEGCWVKTVPGYISALQPYWGSNRLMIAQNRDVSNDIPVLSFSKDTTSSFYDEAMQLVELYDTIPKTLEYIAEYWDDAPGYSGTPPGHLFSIAMQLADRENLSLEESSELFALMGISMCDAFIECWRLKYTFNLIRPISYIQRYISPDFNTIISTPPFPEFPSGHSYQSGAGTEVLKAFFSDSLTFTDNTNAHRLDIVGTPRTFKSFTDLSEEISISRFYGGIHFKLTLDISLYYGRKIGNSTIQHIQFKK